jgi:hypothetical protein
VDEPYVQALGRAAYVFAVLEWNAVWCCERIKPGYIRALKKKTAGTIANDLVALTAKHPDPAVQAAARGPVQEFRRLVDIRNSLLHGKPGTAANGEQRLFQAGEPWSIERVNDAADEFAAGSVSLNALLYDQLKQ